MKRFIFMVSCSFLFITACSNEKTGEIHPSSETKEVTEELVQGNPTVREILESNGNADIFLFNGIVFSNAEEIEWVQQLKLTAGDEVGEIIKQTNNATEFEDQNATKLPPGTKIYKPADYPGPIYIAIIDGREIPYIGLIEG